jgi:hypothetical protein
MDPCSLFLGIDSYEGINSAVESNPQNKELFYFHCWILNNLWGLGTE